MTREAWVRMKREFQYARELKRLRAMRVTYIQLLASTTLTLEERMEFEHQLQNTLLNIDALTGDMPKWFRGGFTPC